MLRRIAPRPRAGLALLALALLGLIVPRAQAFTDGQAASLVLGQPDFGSGAAATSASGMSGPSGVAIDPTTGKVFVADYGNNRVLRFASSAALASGAAAEAVLGQPDFTTSAPATSAAGMYGPFGVVVDAAGRLWVADVINNRVLRFDGAAALPSGATAGGVLGQPDFTSGAAATTASGMRQPYGVAVDGAGRLWVVDFLNSRVLRFDGAAALPHGAPASGVLGQPDFTSGAAATTASGLTSPTGVAADGGGRLWIADGDNNRVVWFDGAAGLANGAAASGVLGQPDFTSNAPATGASGMYRPMGVAVDSAGRLWVGDNGSSRVLWFDGPALANGAPASGVLGQPDFASIAPVTSASGLRSPTGVAVDGAGAVWVADYGNRRVLRFDKAAQSITFAALPDRTVGGGSFTLSATASSGLAVAFSSSTPLVCTVSGTTVTLLSVGPCTIAADQAGDKDHQPAPQVARSFRVKAAQTIAFAVLPDRSLGDSPLALSAIASSGLAVVYTSSTPAVCTVSGTTVTLVAAGTCTIAADQPGDSSYAAAPQVVRSFTVRAAKGSFAAHLPLVVR